MTHEEITSLILNAPTAGAAAGAWWASALRKPDFDNGSRDPANIMARILAEDMAADNPQNESALEVFAGKLAERVNKQLEAQDRPMNLSVDYHPDMILVDAAHEANLTINGFGWPWKTNMRITRTQVQVRAGHSAPYVIIWNDLADVSS